MPVRPFRPVAILEIQEPLMLAALDHNDIMGLITFAASASLWAFVIGLALWSQFAQEH
ncbi:MAG: hypothetical protein BroJett014_16400 [Planctomycetota bacterium]|nr:MAG: hypothetical protein BroJett014_16400 [Planctomycetota bacterium]